MEFVTFKPAKFKVVCRFPFDSNQPDHTGYRLTNISVQDGNKCGCEAAQADQVSSGIQSESRYEKGQCGSDEEVL